MNMSGMDMSSSTTTFSTKTTSTSTSMDMSGMDMSSSSTTTSSSMTMTMDMSSTSSSTMDMSGMDMSSSATSATSSTDMSGMDMSSSTSSSTSTSTSTSDSMSSMDMSSDDDYSMSMTMWMTTTYKGTPVFFRTLDANSPGAAFGIFCVVFFSSFFFRGLLFLSSYLEQAVFHNYANTIVIEEDCECAPSDKESPLAARTVKHPGFGTVIKKLFWMGPKELMHDIVRLLLSFTIVMFGYAIMLAAMSFVVLYFFAICLGLSFGEIFFNRLSIILNINKSFGACSGMH